MSLQTFWRVAILLVLAGCVYVLANVAYLAYVEHRLTLQARQFRADAENAQMESTLSAAEEHVRLCLAQGHRGGPYGC